MQRCSDAETSHRTIPPPRRCCTPTTTALGPAQLSRFSCRPHCQTQNGRPISGALSHMISRRGLYCLVPDLVVQSREMRGPGTERARGQAGFLFLYCVWLGRLGRKQAVSSLAPRRGVHTSPRQRTEAIIFIFILKLPRSSRTCDMTHHHPWPGDTLSCLSTQFCELFSSR